VFGFAQPDGILDLGMLVDIENAPVFVISVTASAARGTSVAFTPRNRFLDNSQRGSVKRIDGYNNLPPAAMRCAISANSSGATIGVAPYRPARYRRPTASSLRGLRSASG
jgi:hypothetical protein